MNTWTITGRLGKDAEVKTFNDGNKVANLNVAVEDRKKNANGEYEITTTWVQAHLNNPSDKMVSALKKGTLLMLQGKPYATTYRNKDGNDVVQMEMRVYNLEFLASPKADQPSDDFGDLPFNK